MGRQREASSLVEGDDEDSWLHGGRGRGDERLRCSCTIHRVSIHPLTGRGSNGKQGDIPIPLLSLEVELGDGEVAGVSSAGSPLIVEVDDDRPKDWARGARCVSFSSSHGVR